MVVMGLAGEAASRWVVAGCLRVWAWLSCGMVEAVDEKRKEKRGNPVRTDGR